MRKSDSRDKDTESKKRVDVLVHEPLPASPGPKNHCKTPALQLALNFVNGASTGGPAPRAPKNRYRDADGTSTDRIRADLANGLHRHLPYPSGLLTNLRSNGL